MPRRKVYLETTIPSYLAAWPSRDLIISAHQQITHEWWETRRPEFDLFNSALVIEEASAGDPSASARRLDVIRDLPLLELTEEVIKLGGILVKRGAIPKNQSEDALHFAVAVVHGMDYLLTWNLSHIAQAEARNRIESTCRTMEYNRQ